MDEIIIDDKKYISSKQAAKLTGYAKDYVGQLCREGRVPARLVGRSWYVLEAAIQDHRFGAVQTPPEVKNSPKKASERDLVWKAEAPRYEAAPVDLLPPIHRVKNAQPEPVTEVEPVQSAHESLQNSWKDWFDRVGEAIKPTKPEETEITAPDSEEVQHVEPESYESEADIEEKTEGRIEEEIQIPIHALYTAPPKELLPHYAEVEETEPTPIEEHFAIPTNRKLLRSKGHGVIRFVSIILALAVASIAVIGSGVLDPFVVPFNQLSVITGLVVSNK